MLRREGRKAATKERIGWGAEMIVCSVCGKEFPLAQRCCDAMRVCERCRNGGRAYQVRTPKRRYRSQRANGEQVHSINPCGITYVSESGGKRTVRTGTSSRRREPQAPDMEKRARWIARYEELLKKRD